MRCPFQAVFFLIGLVAAFAGYFLIDSEKNLGLLVLLGGGIAILEVGGFWVLMVYCFVREKMGLVPPFTYKLIFTDAGLSILRGGNMTQLKWADIKRIRKTPRGYDIDLLRVRCSGYPTGLSPPKPPEIYSKK